MWEEQGWRGKASENEEKHMYESLGSQGSNLEYEFRKVMAEKGTCRSNIQISEHGLGTVLLLRTH